MIKSMRKRGHTRAAMVENELAVMSRVKAHVHAVGAVGGEGLMRFEAVYQDDGAWHAVLRCVCACVCAFVCAREREQ